MSDEYELDLLLYSLKYARENIARGHIEKVARDFAMSIGWYVDSELFLEMVQRRRLPARVSLSQKKVTLRSIDAMLDAPLILYVDRFHLWKEEWGSYYRYHYPHFIVVTGRSGDKYRIIDPDDGKVRWVAARVLSRAISGLRNHLWISPQIIRL